MIITKRKVTEEQIEVNFPHYSTDGICHWYKAISEYKMIKIFIGSGGYCTVDLTEYNVYNAFDDKCTIITEQDFLEKFNEAMTNITENI
jgi:hypothetical protein